MTTEEIEELLNTDPEARKVFDRKVQSALNTYRETHDLDEKKIADQLRAIDRAAQAKIAQIELSNYKEQACQKAGIDVEILGNLPLATTEEIDAAVAKASTGFKQSLERALNERLARDSYKPGGGGDHNEDAPKSMYAQLAAEYPGLSDNDIRGLIANHGGGE